MVNDLFVARYHWRRGRLDQARAVFRERARMAEAEGDRARAIDAMTSLVAIASAAGDLEQGRATLRETLRTFPLETIPEDTRPDLELAIAYAQVGQAKEARFHLQLANAQGPRAGSLNYDERRRAIGLIEYAEGRHVDALRTLSAASRFGQCVTCLLLDVAMAAEAAGQHDVAAATYDRYVSLAPFALGRAENLGFVLVRLAQLQDSLGKHGEAQATRAALRSLWNRADPAALALIERESSPASA